MTPRLDDNHDHSTKNESTTPDLMEAALAYAARGLLVFPLHTVTPGGGCTCGSRGCDRIAKHPNGQLAPNGLHDATTDPAMIGQWWALFPDANIGIRTGAVSGLFVVDVDSGDGWHHLHRLERESGPFPATWRAHTGGDGLHVYLGHPGGHVPTNRGRIAPGIDLRGDGGYVVAPPSRHRSGRSYRWIAGSDPDGVPLADAPLWLLARLTAPTPRQSARLAEDEMIPAGGRNDRLMRFGARLRAAGCTEAEILAAVQTINTTRCQPPLDPTEVATIAASVARYEPGAARPRYVTIRSGKAVRS